MYRDKVCEHCLIGMKLHSLYGTSFMYECAKDIRHKDCSAGFENPCSGYIDCYEYEKSGRSRDWNKFKYKLILRSEMKKSESCLRQEKEEEAERKEEARKMRAQAECLLIEARSLEGKK